MNEPVKGKSEAGRHREERARLTRHRIVEAAIRLFLDQGYVATTVESIAREASVAPATVYQAFGTKLAILGAGLDLAIAGGPEPVAVLERGWVRAVGDEPDPRQRLSVVLDHTTDIAARTAPIKEVMRDAAAIEPSVHQLIRQDHERRYQTQQELVRVIVGHSAAASPLPGDTATDTFFALVNSDTFRLLVVHLGWTLAQWRAWLFRVLSNELFGSDSGG